MPIYGYDCGQCGQSFDRLEKLDAPPAPCPHCNGSDLKRQVSAAAVRLAGSGWYETDFKSKREARRNLAGDGPAPRAAPTP